jgi:hypothetical protein
VVLVAALAVCTSAVRAAPDGASSTLGWIELSLFRIEKRHFDVPRENRAAALVALAIYDAVTRVREGSERYAAAGAATTVLEYLLPGQRQNLEAQAAGYERVDPSSFAVGVAVGRAAVARARTDGASAKWHGTLPTGPGEWVPTPPSPNPPLNRLRGIGGRGTSLRVRSSVRRPRPSPEAPSSGPASSRCTTSRGP